MTSLINNTYITIYNKQTQQFEINLGDNVYMIFDKCPSYKVVNRDTNILKFNSVLKELTNNTQKILKTKLTLFNSKFQINQHHKWFNDYYETKKKEFTFEQMVTLVANAQFNDDIMTECNKRHNKDLTERYEGIMKLCPIKVEFCGKKTPKSYN